MCIKMTWLMVISREGNIGILNCPFFFLHFIYVRSFFIFLSLTFFIISFRYVWICMTCVSVSSGRWKVHSLTVSPQ